MADDFSQGGRAIRKHFAGEWEARNDMFLSKVVLKGMLDKRGRCVIWIHIRSAFQ